MTPTSSSVSSLAGLSGKTAIVTGSTQGLGADVARVLASYGVNVVISGRNTDNGQALADEINQTGAKRATFYQTDIQNDDDIQACIQHALSTFGGLNFLVNNACSYNDSGVQSSRQQWHETLGVNLVSAAMFCQFALPHLKRGSVIINMGSTGGKFGAAGRALYPASKAALMQFTRNLAVTVAADGIRALSVSPAWTWSPSVQKLSQGSRQKADQVGAHFHPLGRVGDGAEIGQAIAFLCSDGASWMTGVDIPVDGGFSSLGPDQGIAPSQWFTTLLQQKN